MESMQLHEEVDCDLTISSPDGNLTTLILTLNLDISSMLEWVCSMIEKGQDLPEDARSCHAGGHGRPEED